MTNVHSVNAYNFKFINNGFATFIKTTESVVVQQSGVIGGHIVLITGDCRCEERKLLRLCRLNDCQQLKQSMTRMAEFLTDSFGFPEASPLTQVLDGYNHLCQKITLTDSLHCITCSIKRHGGDSTI